MVVFTCGHCGESIQKPKVEKHYLTKCRNKNPNVSCMDCFKDFLGQDYEAHTKCITEEERYSGKGFMAKEKKGEKKQNAWVEMVQSVLEEQQGAPKNVLRIVEAISKHNNTPRKKPKFVNFVKNICGHKTNQADIDQAWELISVKLAALSAVTQNGKPNNDVKAINGKQVNGHNNHGIEKSINEEEIEQSNENNEQNGDTENKEELTEEQNEENEKENVNLADKKKLSKKQRKEEKKRQKYEAELQSVAIPAEEVEEQVTEVKKGKKKKNRTESNSGDVEDSVESKKQKKRKRQDTVNSVNGVQETEVIANPTESEVVVKEKTKKKKQKVDSAEKGEESVCLHDQNVATIEETVEQTDGKFDWHAVIMSVLEKKGNEVPFKRLQKKVLSEYSEATGREVDDRIAEKFIKKLKSAPNVRVDKNRVLLIE